MTVTEADRTDAFGYLSNQDTPLYTLTELGELIEAFVTHQECNKDVLIKTGRYRIDFRRSWWLHASLSNLYYTKLPWASRFITLGFASDEETLSLDPCGQHSPFDRYEANCYHTPVSDERCKLFNDFETPDCGYLECRRSAIMGHF